MTFQRRHLCDEDRARPQDLEGDEDEECTFALGTWEINRRSKQEQRQDVV
jgi:hypothetical protein